MSEPRGERSFSRPAWLISLLVTALTLVAPAASHAQLFLASRPEPPFTIGPLMVRAAITEGSDVATVTVLWSLVIPSDVKTADVAQDLYLVWPAEVQGADGLGKPDPAVAKYVEDRGFSVINDGRVKVTALRIAESGGAPEPLPGGAPFVVFVQTGGALGLSPPATFIRIPWTPRLADPGWLIELRMKMSGLIKPRKGTWAEELFVGGRYEFRISFNEVRDRPLFPMYFAHRDRVIRLADAPAELAANFAQADRLKIAEVFPVTAIRRLSETEDTTEVVSLFLDKGEGITPQHLSVQFGYFSRIQAWAVVLVPTLFFVLGQAIGPALGRTALRALSGAGARLQLGRWSGRRAPQETGVIVPREVLERIVPGQTTREEVLRLCGPAIEQRHEFPGADRTTLVYRGRRLSPHVRPRFGWLATVEHWNVEDHEVRIALAGDVVRDVTAQVRQYRATQPPSGDAAQAS